MNCGINSRKLVSVLFTAGWQRVRKGAPGKKHKGGPPKFLLMVESVSYFRRSTDKNRKLHELLAR